MQELKQAASAMRGMVLSSDGRIRTAPRGHVLGHVEHDRDGWHAYVGNHHVRDDHQLSAARRALSLWHDQVAVNYLADLIGRHPDRQEDIELAVETPEHQGGLLGLANKRHLASARTLSVARAMHQEFKRG